MSEENRLTLLGVNFDFNDPAQLQSLKESIPLFEQEFVTCLRSPFPEHSDAAGHVVIIGGGIIGLLTAVFLRMEGHQVTLLERKLFGAAASTRNSGGILALGRDVREIPMILTSIQLWHTLKELGIHTEVQETGHTMIAMNDSEVTQLLQARDLYAAAGLRTEWMSPKEVRSLLPDLTPNCRGALYSQVDAQDYPFAVISSAVSWLKQHGAQLVDRSEVIGFEVTGTRVTAVQTSKGIVAGDVVVLCAGPWTNPLGERLGLTLPVLPRRSQIAVTESFNARRMYPFVSGNGLYARQTQFGNVVFGGGGSWEKVGYDVENTSDVLQLLSTRLVELFPSYRTRQVIRGWAGTVEITPDHFPLLGAIDSYDNLYVSSGYSGHGYGMAAAAGRILSRMVSVGACKSVLPPLVTQSLSIVHPMRFQSVFDLHI